MPSSIGYPKNASARTKWIRERREIVRRPSIESKPHILLEEEIDHNGNLLNTGIVFLINRECPWTCVMCDLWKNTSEKPMPPHHATNQIKLAIHQLEKKTKKPIKQLKLYNSGSFFDTKAIYPNDYEDIAKSLTNFDRVIVENHPKLAGQNVSKFNDFLKPQLEVALGLETANDDLLDKLNKRFSIDDYKKTCAFFNSNHISHRAFIMVQPPFTHPEESIELCHQSVKFAFNQNASCVSLIPSRATTGAMHALQKTGAFVQPSLKTLEKCFSNALNEKAGRVFVDLWDLKLFSTCDSCFESRKNRLDQMNQLQKILPKIQCQKCLQ